MVLTSVTIGNEVYDAHLCQATNFLNAPRMSCTNFVAHSEHLQLTLCFYWKMQSTGVGIFVADCDEDSNTGTLPSCLITKF